MLHAHYTFMSFISIYSIHFSFMTYFLNETYKTIFIINSDNGHPSLVFILSMYIFTDWILAEALVCILIYQKVTLLFSILLGRVINISDYFFNELLY